MYIYMIYVYINDMCIYIYMIYVYIYIYISHIYIYNGIIYCYWVTGCRLFTGNQSRHSSAENPFVQTAFWKVNLILSQGFFGWPQNCFAEPTFLTRKPHIQNQSFNTKLVMTWMIWGYAILGTPHLVSSNIFFL